MDACDLSTPYLCLWECEFSTLNKGEEYGLFFPAVPAEQESRAATWLFGLQQNAETRTNLAIVNLGSEPNRFAIENDDGKAWGIFE